MRPRTRFAFHFAIYALVCWPSLLFLAFLSFATPIATEAQQESPASLSKGLCYTFLRDGDVWTVCDGKREQIPLRARVLHYAVSADGFYFALLTQEPSSGAKAVAQRKLLLVSLAPQLKTVATKTEYDYLRGTCGTVLGYKAGSGTATDIISRQILNVRFKHFFHCDSDRRIIVGWDQTNPTSASLILEIDGRETKKFAVFHNHGDEFNVSPKGEYIAFFREERGFEHLCTLKIGSEAQCAPEGSDEVGFDGISLSDSGGALFTGHTGKGCFYRDMGHFSEKPRAGYPNEDECVGVYFWHAGMRSPALIEGLGRYGQWITPEVAARIHDWSTTLPSSAHQQ